MDRYKALGIPEPKLETMCSGQCEGTGLYPVFVAQQPARAEELGMVSCLPVTDRDRAAWQQEHENRQHTCDGWHFIECRDCNGTGLRG